jgi:two-component system, LytTR family, sensor kinase
LVYRKLRSIDGKGKREKKVDIYLPNNQMSISIDRKRFSLFLRIGLIFLVIWTLGDLFTNPENLLTNILSHIWILSYLLVVNFILFEYTIPFIKLRWERLVIAPFLLFGHVLMYSLGMYIWRGLGARLYIHTPLKTYDSIEAELENITGRSMASIFFFGLARHIYNYILLKRSARQLRIEKQEAELNYLKSQTNPHFLFNTLNNIYSLARDKSDLAPESILRLSKILRFMLYEAGGAYIAIEQELKIINDYIALEKLRYDDSLRVNFNYSIEDMKQSIPPLLLIPLVENAFKHGVSETRHQPFVDIHLSVLKLQVSFSVKNSTEAVGSGDAPGGAQTAIKENIGLSNLRRQLQLLYTDYHLSCQQGESVFTTTLKINLASHVQN